MLWMKMISEDADDYETEPDQVEEWAYLDDIIGNMED